MLFCKFIFLFSVFACSCGLSALDVTYGLGAKKEGEEPITQVQFLGERCSGTNYLQALIVRNFNFDPPYFGFSSKHFPVWLEGKWFQGTEQGQEGSRFYRKNDHCLVIVIFRNPYDWLHSFCEKPYHTSEAFKKSVKKDFSRFIRATWDAEPDRQYIECNPEDGSAFKNVMRLRTARIQNMLAIGEIVKNVYYVQYEKLRDYPEEVIAEIASIFSLTPADPFVPVTEQYKARHVISDTFIPKEYPEISKEDLRHINKNLDPELEKSIGYELMR